MPPQQTGRLLPGFIDFFGVLGLIFFGQLPKCDALPGLHLVLVGIFANGDALADVPRDLASFLQVDGALDIDVIPPKKAAGPVHHLEALMSGRRSKPGTWVTQ